MTKLVCVKCQTELRPYHNGTIVIETASFGPYKVWNADTLKCPGCDIEIVGGFADHPMRSDHYALDFLDWLKKLKEKQKKLFMIMKGQLVMKKHSNRPNKRNMPKDLRRVTKKDGKRVWIAGGKEYDSLAQITMALRIKP